MPIKLGSMSNAAYRIVELEKPTEEQRKIYRSWLGTN
jgi:hypothetical protein